MSIDFILYPVDGDALRRDEAWVAGYIEEREREFWEWQQDPTAAAATDDPRRDALRRYSHHLVHLLNPYLDAAHGIEPYSWFARDQISEFLFVTPPGEIAVLASMLSRSPEDVRDRLDALARANLDLTGTRRPPDGGAGEVATDEAVAAFWRVMADLHADLRDFYQRAADRRQAMIGSFSP